ncbi:MAG TPA: RNA-binding cell elongation regulator Jag/EloR [Acidimicrobiales bacterium]|nr:RNA-binding cell elongation regulator Jag/EloR [Acidimicrobiales bacterium]
METTGRTIEEAKDAALDQLGVDDADAEFVVVSEPKAGLFGRMRGEARVRARVRPTSPRPKRTRTRRQGEREGARRSGGAGRSRSGSRTGEAATAATAVAEGDGTPTTGDVGADSANGSASTRRRRSRSRGGRGPSGGGAVGNEAVEEATEEGGETPRPPSRARNPRPSAAAKEETVTEELSLEEQVESARGFIAGMIDELGLEASVSTRTVDEETAEVVVEGPELGVLIGPGGATLAAVQELARTFVQKRTGGQSSRIVVDVAGYRAKRVAALQRFTQQIAEEVLASGSERALEPMSAADRKVVHDTVNAIEGLMTRSEGEDPRRYIVIAPVAVVASGEEQVG